MRRRIILATFSVLAIGITTFGIMKLFSSSNSPKKTTYEDVCEFLVKANLGIPKLNRIHASTSRESGAFILTGVHISTIRDRGERKRFIGFCVSLPKVKKTYLVKHYKVIPLGQPKDAELTTKIFQERVTEEFKQKETAPDFTPNDSFLKKSKPWKPTEALAIPNSALKKK